MKRKLSGENVSKTLAAAKVIAVLAVTVAVEENLKKVEEVAGDTSCKSIKVNSHLNNGKT